MSFFETKIYRLFVRNRCASYLKKYPSLVETINNSNETLGTIGLSIPDYVSLYKTVRTLKPEKVLELGTGKSTHVIALAMQENGNAKTLISMEEGEEWSDQARKNLPERYQGLVEIRLSPTEIYKEYIFQGSSYRDTPIEHFDFVFIDGPKIKGRLPLNMDLLKVLDDKPTSVWIDGRKQIVAVYSILFGYDKVEYFSGYSHSIIRDITKKDILSNREMTQRMFSLVKKNGGKPPFMCV